MKTIALIIGLIGTFLGGFWTLQGLGVVHVRPILCFADCAPVQEASSAWVITGSLVMAAGVLAVLVSLKRRAQR